MANKFIEHLDGTSTAFVDSGEVFAHDEVLFWGVSRESVVEN